jgi:hypothetical protein
MFLCTETRAGVTRKLCAVSPDREGFANALQKPPDVYKSRKKREAKRVWYTSKNTL